MEKVAVRKAEDLDVYKKAYALALEIHRCSIVWPKYEQYGGLADQIRRSSKSVCANLAEGLGKRMSEADEVRFLQTAMGSAVETKTWSSFVKDLAYEPENVALRWCEECEEITRMIVGLVRKRQ